MTIETTTHLNFRGIARQALEYYQGVFGGQLFVATYGDFGMPESAPGADKIVFGQVDNHDGFRVMAYDIPGENDIDATVTAGATHRSDGVTMTDRTFFQSVRAGTLDEITSYWNKLAEGGTIIEPVAASAWTPGFGMVTDRFGVTWILDVRAPDAS